ncbi:unnamed protein product [Pocillopora meandrina]|uniref:Transposase n=1 Tax=Pocillopora meandrina TaxID=46732 RepID=A0AAU9XJ08_9CNID|nr:unnamed protein product [Pocillopora meandrina]
MGEAAVKSHMKSKKHVDAVKGTFVLGRSEQPCSSGAGDIRNYVASNETLAAEVLWALKVILSHYSYKSCEDIPELFKRMFPDSQIASKFSCGEKKCAYLACFGIAPYFQRKLTDEVTKLELFVLLFDESHNKVTQTKQMDLHVRFWDAKNSRVQTRYLTSVFLGHATADDLLEKIVSYLDSIKIQKSNILQLSMDGPNVNWKLHELFQELISEVDENAPILVNVGSCGLHIVHNAFKAGSKASTWSIQEVLSSLHWLFVDSPARREDYTEITSSVVFPIKYCKHRWLENLPVVVRAQEIWKEVTFYVTTVQRSSKYSVPTSKSYKTIRDSTQDPLMPLKFAAFESVAKQLQPFLVQFQSDSPLLPFVASSLEKVIRGLMKRFVKADVLQGASSAVKLLKIDFKKRENCLDVEKLDVGFVAATKLKRIASSQENQ